MVERATGDQCTATPTTGREWCRSARWALHGDGNSFENPQPVVAAPRGPANRKY